MSVLQPDGDVPFGRVRVGYEPLRNIQDQSASAAQSGSYSTEQLFLVAHIDSLSFVRSQIVIHEHFGEVLRRQGDVFLRSRLLVLLPHVLDEDGHVVRQVHGGGDDLIPSAGGGVYLGQLGLHGAEVCGVGR